MASFTICEITDGTTTVSLLGPFFKVESWRPAIAQAKGGGTFQSSPLADGRRLVNRRFENVIETPDLSAKATTQDSFAHQYQELERLLEKATQYWTTSWQNAPVYLKTKTSCETENRYALIYNYALPDINQVLRAPFAAKTVGMSNFSLSMERGHWLANVPGDETCVEISGMGAQGYGTADTFYPVLNTDDGNYDSTGGAIHLAATDISVGDTAGLDLDGLFRFQDVTIPQGSIITTAYLRFQSSGADGGVPVLQIRGQDSDDAATFSTAGDWIARPQTANAIAWSPGAWVLNGLYNSPSIVTVVQEIVDRAGWLSGNNMVIAVEDNGSPANIHRDMYSIEDVAGAAAELHVTYISAAGAGQEATCDAEVYVANKHNYRGLTHIWYFDNGVGFSANLLGTVPQTLLPAVPAVDDILYFGIEPGPITTIQGGGPFFSLVFDLSTAQSGCTFIAGWEYWNGGAWAALTIMDNTDTSDPLDTAGVNSVHWREETSWTPNAINGVTAFWVRLHVTAVAAPSPPVQQTRDVYTILWPYVEVDEAQVKGDISALLRAALDNQAYYNSNVEISRVIMGLRSGSRGLDFTPYLNCSDEQEIAGIQVGTPGGTSLLAADPLAPTGTMVQWIPVGVAAMSYRVRWTFSDIGGVVAPMAQWYGSFHAFARVNQTAGTPGDFALQLTVDIGDQDYNSSGSPVTVLDVGFPEIVDLGRIDIPQGTGILNTGEALYTLNIELHGSSLGAGTLDIYDLILMPADEMLIDAQIQTNKLDGGAIQDDEVLSIDSVVYPKSSIRSLVRYDERVLSLWRTKGPLAFLQANQDQRLWFFLMNWDPSIPVGWLGRFSMAAQVQAFNNWRYLSLRGER